MIMVSKRHGLVGSHRDVPLMMTMKITAKNLHPGADQA